MPIYQIPVKGLPTHVFLCGAVNITAAKFKYAQSGEINEAKEISITECARISGLSVEYIEVQFADKARKNGGWFIDFGSGKLGEADERAADRNSRR